MAKQPARKRTGKRLGTRIHRWAGMSSLLIVLIVAMTGILLNHTESLKLNERRVKSGPVLRHYGIEPDGDPILFKSKGDQLLALWDGQLIFNEVIVDFAPEGQSLIGAGEIAAGEFAFVFKKLVVVCDESGGLLDRLDEASLPTGNIRHAGSADSMLIVEMDTSERFGLKDWIEAVPQTGEAPKWFESSGEISAGEREKLAAAFRGEGLPLSRIILDLHSGRLFGTIGVILYDLAAAILVVLGITGVLLWVRRR